jgi:hypothetical protein
MGKSSSRSSYSGKCSAGSLAGAVMGYSHGVRSYAPSALRPNISKGVDLWQYHDKMMKSMQYQIEQKKFMPYEQTSPLEKVAYSAKAAVDYAGKKQMYSANSNLGYGVVAMAGTANPYQGKIINIAAYRNLNNSYRKADSRGYKADFEYKQAA